MKRRSALTACVLLSYLFLSCGCGVGGAATEGGAAEAREHAAPITNGTLETGDPAVVAVGARRLGCGDRLAPHCTGTLVAPRLVLTAAHCVADPRLGTTIEVLFGSDVASPGALVLPVAQAVIHPDYDSDSGASDLAALILAEPAEIPPISLASAPQGPSLVGSSVRVVGFGQADPNAPLSGQKQSGTSLVTSLDVDTFRAEGGPSLSCHGDSGGPVLALEGQEGSELVLIGVAWSGDPGCGSYSVNGRVDRYADDFVKPWIEASSMAAPPGGAGSIAPEALCSSPCVSHTDCPAGLECRPTSGPSGLLSRCVVPGLLVGDLGSECKSKDQCHDGNGCVRVRSDDGSGACRCYRACPAPPVDPLDASAGEAAEAGACSVGGAPRFNFAVMLISIAVTLSFRRYLRKKCSCRRRGAEVYFSVTSGTISSRRRR
jgi:hypothetical protein